MLFLGNWMLQVLKSRNISSLIGRSLSLEARLGGGRHLVLKLHPFLHQLRLLVYSELTLSVQLQRGESVTEHRIRVLLTSNNLKVVVMSRRSLEVLVLYPSWRLLILVLVVELLR